MKKTFAGHDLRTQLTAVKVALGGKMDELKELDLDTLTENQFDKKMAEVKKLVSDSKMLRVQVKAVARELVAWLHFLFWWKCSVIFVCSFLETASLQMRLRSDGAYVSAKRGSHAIWHALFRYQYMWVDSTSQLRGQTSGMPRSIWARWDNAAESKKWNWLQQHITTNKCNNLRTDTDVPRAGATLREQLDQEKLAFAELFCSDIISVVFWVRIYFNCFWSFYGPCFFETRMALAFGQGDVSQAFAEALWFIYIWHICQERSRGPCAFQGEKKWPLLGLRCQMARYTIVHKRWWVGSLSMAYFVANGFDDCFGRCRTCRFVGWVTGSSAEVLGRSFARFPLPWSCRPTNCSTYQSLWWWVYDFSKFLYVLTLGAGLEWQT